jgi:hypothetical protein
MARLDPPRPSLACESPPPQLGALVAGEACPPLPDLGVRVALALEQLRYER